MDRRVNRHAGTKDKRRRSNQSSSRVSRARIRYRVSAENGGDEIRCVVIVVRAT